jgi:hypothetical protein
MYFCYRGRYFFAKGRKPTFISMVKYLKAKNKVDDRDWRIDPPLLSRGPIGVLAAKLAGDRAGRLLVEQIPEVAI